MAYPVSRLSARRSWVPLENSQRMCDCGRVILTFFMLTLALACLLISYFTNLYRYKTSNFELYITIYQTHYRNIRARKITGICKQCTKSGLPQGRPGGQMWTPDQLLLALGLLADQQRGYFRFLHYYNLNN